jgi:hypothetical protein
MGEALADMADQCTFFTLPIYIREHREGPEVFRDAHAYDLPPELGQEKFESYRVL